MSARISTPGRLAVASLAASLALAPVLEAGSAYLPITGPTPLRFEVAMMRPAPLPPAPSSASLEKIEAAPSPVATTPVPTNPPDEVIHSGPDTNAPSTTVTEMPASTPYAAHSAADNLLVITPQMLAEYFKPFPNATNAAGVSVVLPIPVGFTPPTDKNPASSRATYKVQ